MATTRTDTDPPLDIAAITAIRRTTEAEIIIMLGSAEATSLADPR